jgi:hypothetical protein
MLWMANAVVAFAFPPIVQRLGIAQSFFIFAILGVFAMIFIATTVPETRGKTLEEFEDEAKYAEEAGEPALTSCAGKPLPAPRFPDRVGRGPAPGASRVRRFGKIGDQLLLLIAIRLALACAFVVFADARLQPERLLRRLWRSEMDPFQLQHMDLGSRAARRRKPAHLAARREHPMARDDQRNWVLCHCLPDIAGGLGAGAQFLRQGAVGGRMPPADPAKGGIGLLEEVVLPVEIEPDA